MAHDHILDDGQTQAAAGFLRTFVPEKPVEGAFPEFGGNTRPVVRHRQHRLVVLRIDANVDFSAALDIADGIVDQVAEHRAQSLGIAGYSYPLVNVESQ